LDGVVGSIKEKAPSLVAVGREMQLHLVTENLHLFKVDKPEEAPFILLAAFYGFNMQYPKGLSNVYYLLEYIILNQSPQKMSTGLSQFITYLNNV